VILVAASFELPALECAQGNAPAATLLVPYFRVSGNGVTSSATDIPDLPAQTETLLSVTNISDTGLVIHVTVWSKYGKPVLGFNVPMTGKDAMTFRMKDVLNGHLDVNTTTQGSSNDSAATMTVRKQKDLCGINQTSGTYDPAAHVVGFGQSQFLRFPNPDSNDGAHAVSVYADPAFAGAARQSVWNALDESGDVTAMTSPGPWVLDRASECTGAPHYAQVSGDFSGSVTLDVVNYCTNAFPTDAAWWTNGALATAGWDTQGPNALIGDVFYVDSTTDGNISGESMVALRYAPDLGGWNGPKTFYGRYDVLDGPESSAVPEEFRFVGDGRQALATRYGFRYLSDAAHGLRSWALVYRTDRYASGANDLCAWATALGPKDEGPWDFEHQVGLHLFDLDENEWFGGSCGSCPPPGPYYVFLETQRIDLLDNGDLNPPAYRGGWIDVTFPGSRYAQAYVGVQHSGHGQFLSVGHAASPLDPGECGRQPLQMPPSK
jgi:hypothetical protein